MESKRFKAKVGYCYLYPDKIILARSGNVEDIDYRKEESRVRKTLLLYAVAAFLFIRQAILSFDAVPVVASVVGAFGTFFGWAVLTGLNSSSAALIERKKIRSVTFTKGIPPLTRSRFKVSFEDKNGRIKKRFIYLPGSLNDGEEETRMALEMMRVMGYYGEIQK